MVRNNRRKYIVEEGIGEFKDRTEANRHSRTQRAKNDGEYKKKRKHKRFWGEKVGCTVETQQICRAVKLFGMVL